MASIAKNTPKISNPLTMIAVFAGLAEVAATITLPKLDGDIQSVFVWFVMLFPGLLVVLFFITLWWKPAVLYGPSDWKDERIFKELIEGSYVPATADAAEKLRTLWKGDAAGKKKLLAWVKSACPRVPFASFLYQPQYEAKRQQAVKDLELA